MRLIIIIVSSLLNQVVFGQGPGYVVRNNGDTLHGIINYNQRNQGLVFRTAQYYQPISYTIEDVKSFSVNGEIYERLAFSRRPPESLKPFHMKQLNLYKRVIKDSAYCKLAVKGQLLSLYEYFDIEANEKAYLCKKDSEAPIPMLICRCQDSDHYQTTEHHYFRKVLAILAYELKVPQPIIDEIYEATIDEIVPLIQLINGQSSRHFLIKKFSPFLFRFHALAGQGIGICRLVDWPNHSIHHGHISTAGIALETASRLMPELMFRGELNFQNHNYEPIFFRAINVALGVKIQVPLDSAISISGGFMFSLSKKKNIRIKTNSIETFQLREIDLDGIPLRASIAVRRWELTLSGTLRFFSADATRTNIYSVNIGFRFLSNDNWKFKF